MSERQREAVAGSQRAAARGWPPASARLGAGREPLVQRLDEPVGAAPERARAARSTSTREARDRRRRRRSPSACARRGSRRPRSPRCRAPRGPGARRRGSPRRARAARAARRRAARPRRRRAPSPTSGASAIGRESIACRKPLRSTAARPASDGEDEVAPARAQSNLTGRGVPAFDLVAVPRGGFGRDRARLDLEARAPRARAARRPRPRRGTPTA